jgi:uncharacterized membrane protein
MLVTVVIVIEAILLIGSLINLSHFRLVSGRDFNTTRKLTALQAVIVLILVVFLQIVGTAQSQQADTARKTIAGRLGSAIQTYAANNGSNVLGFSCAMA